MPIYEYQCDLCGKKFEALRSMGSADSPIPCDGCKSDSTRRMLSLFFAHNSNGVLSGGEKSCGGCSGGTCSSCNI